jgi:GntR family transcriptional regulator, galactonate operon transcriptional repressor
MLAEAGTAPRVYTAKGVHGRVMELLAQRILGGALAPDALLPREAELAQQLGASRTAVREALKVLAAKGLVESRQRRGTTVRQSRFWNLLDPDLLAWHTAAGASPALTTHLVELRRMIEPPSARLAAERHGEAELAVLADAAAAMRASLHDPAAYNRADLAFHRAVFAASGNPFLDRLGTMVTQVLEVSFHLQQRSGLPFGTGLVLHERVLDAIRGRDAAAAERAMLEIIEAARLELERADLCGAG